MKKTSIIKLLVPAVLLAGIFLSIQAKASLHYVINNHLGAPEMLLDENRQVVWQAEYDEFGKAQILIEKTEFNHRLPGQYYDKETGLHYNYYRDYDSALGRYVQSDTIGLVGGINTYGYVQGNPLMYVDPLGLYTEVIIWQPVGWGSSSFGHVSTDINGKTFSFGRNGMTKISTPDYLDKNSFRDGMGVSLDLSPLQEKTLEKCLDKNFEDYDSTSNNCGNPLQTCLKTIGIDTGSKMLPVSLGNKLLDLDIYNGSVWHPATTSSEGTSAPWTR